MVFKIGAKIGLRSRSFSVVWSLEMLCCQCQWKIFWIAAWSVNYSLGQCHWLRNSSSDDIINCLLTWLSKKINSHVLRNGWHKLIVQLCNPHWLHTDRKRPSLSLAIANRKMGLDLYIQTSCNLSCSATTTPSTLLFSLFVCLLSLQEAQKRAGKTGRFSCFYISSI